MVPTGMLFCAPQTGCQQHIACCVRKGQSLLNIGTHVEGVVGLRLRVQNFATGLVEALDLRESFSQQAFRHLLSFMPEGGNSPFCVDAVFFRDLEAYRQFGQLL